MKTIKCDMLDGCTNPVTHISEKWKYCTDHGWRVSQSGAHVRKLRAWEIQRLLNDQTILYARLSKREFLKRYPQKEVTA